MKTLSLKLDEELFEETEKLIKQKGVARNRYINDALDFYNRFQKRREMAEAFKNTAELVKNSSMLINEEFDHLMDEEAV